MESHVTPEQARIQSLAEDYRSRGYQVMVAPTPHRLPDFLSGYQPDLIVSRGGESTVVEVKSRRSLSTETRTREIARLIEGRPGWSFELVIVGDQPDAPPLNSVAFNRDDVRQSLREAKTLLEGGFTNPALLIGWAALEATLRLLMDAEGIALRRRAPAHVLKQAVEEGLVSREEYRLLSEAMARRNAVAHGYQKAGINREFVSALLSVTDQLWDEAASPQSA